MSRISYYSNLREGYLNNTQYVSRPGSRIENFQSLFSNIVGLNNALVKATRDVFYNEYIDPECTATKGSYCSGDSKAVTICPINTYCNVDKLKKPIPCPLYTYNTTTGNTASVETSCLKCPADKFRIAGSDICRYCGENGFSPTDKNQIYNYYDNDYGKGDPKGCYYPTTEREGFWMRTWRNYHDNTRVKQPV